MIKNGMAVGRGIVVALVAAVVVALTSAPVVAVTRGVPVPYATIQDAVTAAAPGDTIDVAAGTYVETGQIVISKNLSIIGADKATTTIKPGSNTSGTGDAGSWILVNDGITFNLSKVTLDGVGRQIRQAIRYNGSGTVDDVVIQNIVQSGYMGFAIVQGYDNITPRSLTVSNSTFSNFGRVGVQVDNGTGGSTATISGNTFTGKGDGDHLDYAITVEAGSVATITGNTISNCRGVASTDHSTSAAIAATTYFAPGTTATITGNTITGNTYGIAVGYDGTDTSVVTAHANGFAGNDWGITSTAPEVDAEGNWWGSVTGPTVATNPAGTGDQVDAVVDYSPWLATGDASGAPGFQRAIPTEYVVNANTTVPAYATGGIQDGVDFASAGDTVNVAAGTYAEQVEISKPLTLRGTGGPVIQSPASLALSFATSAVNKPVVYVHGVDNVTIEGLTVDGLGRGNANYRFVGIAYSDAGGHVTDVEIKNIEDTPFSGAQHGVGLYAYSSAGTARSLEVDSANVHDFQKTGMVFTGADLSASVHDNIVAGIGDTAVTAQNGIQVSGGAQGAIARNTVSGIFYAGSGWGSTAILGVEAGGTLAISDNIISNSMFGINVDTAADITGNHITGHSLSDWGIIAYGPATISGNEIASNLVAIYTVEAVGITNNTITGFDGVNDWGIIATGSSTGPSAFTGNTVSGTSGAIYLAPSAGATMEVSGNTLSGSAAAGDVGLYIDGNPANGTMNLGASSFDSNLDTYIYLANGAAVDIDATSTLFAGKTGAAMTLAELYATEDKVYHLPDQAGLGLVTWKANSVYVSPSGNIQRGIDAATDGDTVEVAAGTYNQTNIIVNKSLTIRGDVSGACPGPGVDAPQIVGTHSGSERGFIISPGVDNVTIEGFVIRDLGVVPQTEAGGACGIFAWGTSTDPTEHINIRNNAFSAIGWAHVFFFNEAQSAFNDINIDCNSVDLGAEVCVGDNCGNEYGIECTNCVNSTISNNQVSGGWVGILMTAQNEAGNTMTAGNNTISDNTVSDSGGANLQIVPMSIGGPAPTLHDVSISNNHLSGASSAIWSYPSAAGGILRNLTIAGNDITATSPTSAYGVARRNMVWIKSVGGDSAFQDNSLTLNGTVPSSWLGLEVDGDATGNWTIQRNVLIADPDTGTGVDSAGLRLKSGIAATSTIGISCNRIEGWANGISSDVLANSALVRVDHNGISGNASNGFLDAGSLAQIDAANNWWGCADGPGNLGCNGVTGNVGFTPVASSVPECVTCTGAPDDAACNDGNACTQTDTCQSGTCTGSNPVVCSALDECHEVGACDTGTGDCSNPNSAIGKACGDPDATACNAADTCDGSGSCVDRKQPEFTACGDPDTTACNAADSCDATGNCVDRKKAGGTVCLAGTGTCDPDDTCDGSTNTCAATFTPTGTACGDPDDTACNAPDTCNGSGACVDRKKMDGTSCNDGDTCSQTDTCVAGVCTGGNPLPDGTACNDLNPLTCPDQCKGGVCGGPGGGPVCPLHDAVMLPVRPISVSIPVGATAVARKVVVGVRNADISPASKKYGSTTQLVVSSTDCPAGTIAGLPNFGRFASGTPDTVWINDGGTRLAWVPLNISSAAFRSFNRKAPARCTLTLTATNVWPDPSLDLTPENNSVTVELNVIDKNDPEQTDTHETVITSVGPLSVTLNKGTASVARKINVQVINVDYKPVAEQVGDLITVSVDPGDCPAGLLGGVDFDRGTTGVQNVKTLKGGASGTGVLSLTVNASAFDTLNPKSPTRCTAILTATGPSDPESPPLDPSNNTTKLVIDVIDKNDL